MHSLLRATFVGAHRTNSRTPTSGDQAARDCTAKRTRIRSRPCRRKRKISNLWSIARPRILQLERTAFGLERQIADANATMAKARQAIAEQEQQIAQLDNDRMADITKDLRDT